MNRAFGCEDFLNFNDIRGLNNIEKFGKIEKFCSRNFLVTKIFREEVQNLVREGLVAEVNVRPRICSPLTVASRVNPVSKEVKLR